MNLCVIEHITINRSMAANIKEIGNRIYNPRDIGHTHTHTHTHTQAHTQMHKCTQFRDAISVSFPLRVQLTPPSPHHHHLTQASPVTRSQTNALSIKSILGTMEGG